MITIAEPSIKSLLLRLRFQGKLLATGTGFVVQARAGPVLVTNLHNVTGRNPATGGLLSPTGGVPDEVAILHHQADQLGVWGEVVEPLYHQGAPRWVEHPHLGRRADLVALPLTKLEGVQLYPYDVINTGSAISVRPADVVSVVGFPFGLQGGGSLAIWATGFVASEPDVDYDDLPIFLIDCRSRQGQSGSAVLAYRGGGMYEREGGGISVNKGPVSRFLGIYSGRINAESDLGIVWKVKAIQELVTSIS